MPFDEEDYVPSAQSQKVGIKKVSTKESIFDSLPKKPTPEQFEGTVKRMQDQSTSTKRKAAELAMQFHKMMSDKTLPQNKNSFQKDIEIETLKEMINFADAVNNDLNTDKDGEGSISMIALLLKHALGQRDKINTLEYTLSQLENKLSKNLNDLISKEITRALDISKKSE